MNLLLSRYNFSSIGRLWNVEILPDKLLSEKLKNVKEDMLKIEDGISPVREASSMFTLSSLERFPISGGTPSVRIKIYHLYILQE